MAANKLLKTVLAAIEDIKGRDVKTLDVRRLTSITDYMVVAGGSSDRHVKAIADNVIDRVKGIDVRPLGVEGKEQGEWVLIDLGDVVVHVMQPAVREFYQIERLWGTSDPKTVQTDH